MRLALTLLLFLSACEAQAEPPPSVPANSGITMIALRADVNDASAHWLEDRFTAAVIDGTKTVILEIDSPGGSVEAGLRISEMIEEAPFTVVCVVTHRADSMALYIFQSCNLRIMTGTATLTAHEPFMTTEGNRFQLRLAAEALDETSDMMATHFVKKTKLTKKAYLERVSKGNWTLDAETALKLGVVDAVIPSMARAIDALLHPVAKPSARK